MVSTGRESDVSRASCSMHWRRTASVARGLASRPVARVVGGLCAPGPRGQPRFTQGAQGGGGVGEESPHCFRATCAFTPELVELGLGAVFGVHVTLRGQGQPRQQPGRSQQRAVAFERLVVAWAAPLRLPGLAMAFGVAAFAAEGRRAAVPLAGLLHVRCVRKRRATDRLGKGQMPASDGRVWRFRRRGLAQVLPAISAICETAFISAGAISAILSASIRSEGPLIPMAAIDTPWRFWIAAATEFTLLRQPLRLTA